MQGQFSELMSSIHINNNPNPSSDKSGFDQSDAKVPLSLPQELIPFPEKPLNMTGSLFSSPRSISSSSAALQPNTDPTAIFEANGLAGSAHMSATALLQKAAQMGATGSNGGMNCPLMQNTFVTTMAPPSFGVMHHQHDQSFANQFIRKGPQQISPQLLNANGMLDNLGMSNMGLLNGLVNQNNALLKNLRHDSGNSDSTILHGGNSNAGFCSSIREANGSGDMTTVDFLGIEGGARHGKFYEHQRQTQQEAGFDGNGQNIQGLSHFPQQALMEKSMWEV